ncbi:hypothetical protein PUN28_011084 [Cardiocondyla obscurior]|uniref:Uncharacterized protein n=1 Tax=Cardiocondyla obscurior TaxID=286306 RepID=A0AAW2FJH1_9HYME
MTAAAVATRGTAEGESVHVQRRRKRGQERERSRGNRTGGERAKVRRRQTTVGEVAGERRFSREASDENDEDRRRLIENDRNDDDDDEDDIDTTTTRGKTITATTDEDRENEPELSDERRKRDERQPYRRGPLFVARLFGEGSVDPGSIDKCSLQPSSLLPPASPLARRPLVSNIFLHRALRRTRARRALHRKCNKLGGCGLFSRLKFRIRVTIVSEDVKRERQVTQLTRIGNKENYFSSLTSSKIKKEYYQVYLSFFHSTQVNYDSLTNRNLRQDQLRISRLKTVGASINLYVVNHKSRGVISCMIG